MPGLELLADPDIAGYHAKEVNGTTYFPLNPRFLRRSGLTQSNTTKSVYDVSTTRSGGCPPEVDPVIVASLPHLTVSDSKVHQEPSDECRTYTAENEFPYCPPKDQCVGHTRRYSVAVKGRFDGIKCKRESSGVKREQRAAHRRGVSHDS